jgi:hypothetical protein
LEHESEETRFAPDGRIMASINAGKALSGAHVPALGIPPVEDDYRNKIENHITPAFKDARKPYHPTHVGALDQRETAARLAWPCKNANVGPQSEKHTKRIRRP